MSEILLRDASKNYPVIFDSESGVWRAERQADIDRAKGSLFRFVGRQIAVWGEGHSSLWMWWQGRKTLLSAGDLTLTVKDYGTLVILVVRQQSVVARYVEWCPKRLRRMLSDLTYDGFDDPDFSQVFRLIELWKVVRAGEKDELAVPAR